MADQSYLQAVDGGIRVKVHVVPRASKTEIVGLQGESLKVRLQAPPVDGKANAALCEFFADLAGVPKRQVSVVAGQTSREKTILILGAAGLSV